MATHTKFGYSLTKNENYSGYRHIGVNIHYLDNYGSWRQICSIGFQGNKGESFDWYGYQLALNGVSYKEDFSQFVKFAQKIDKANLHNASVADLLQFLADNKMRRLVYDSRLNQYVEHCDYVNTKDLQAYRLHFHGQYIDNCLAYSEIDAEKKFLASMAEQKISYWREMLKNWSEVVISEYFPREVVYCPEIEKWLE